MKKRTLLSMLLMLAMMLSLVGCGSDEKKPTSTDTAVNGTEATTDVAEKPTEVETPTPEPESESESETKETISKPEKTVTTLMSKDESKILHEFNIPNGYTIESGDKSNHIVLINKNKDWKIEIYSGINAEALSVDAFYNSIEGEDRNNFIKYAISNLNMDIDKSYFENIPDDIKNISCVKGDMGDWTGYKESQISYMRFPEEYGKNQNFDYGTSWDLTNHNDSNKYTIEKTIYIIAENNGNRHALLSANETYTIKFTSEYNEKSINEYIDNHNKQIPDDKMFALAAKLDIYERLSNDAGYAMELNFCRYLSGHSCNHCIIKD